MYINDNVIEKIFEKSKQIIKENSIKNAMRKISNLKNPITEEPMGTQKAFKIYCQHIRELMKYNPKKHDNNVDDYINQINDKIKEAYKYI
jgi:hypothetical protein